MKKKIWTLLTTALLALPLFAGATSVYADDVKVIPDPTSTTQTVNIDLHKIAFNKGKAPASPVQNDGLVKPDALKDSVPLNGAEFTMYDVTTKYNDLLKTLSAADAIKTIQDDAKNNTSTLVKAVTTAGEGIASFKDVALADGKQFKAYLFMETKQPAGVNAPATPIVLAMPVYNANDVAFLKGNVNGTQTLSTLNIYPKNELQDTNITKTLQNGTTAGSHQIGDVLPYEIQFVSPTNANAHLQVVDTPSTGLVLTGDDPVVTVEGTTYAVSNYKLDKTTPTGGFTITFTTPADLVGKTIKIDYKMLINGKASDVLKNDVKVNINDGETPLTPPDDKTPKVWTGKQDFVKVDAATTTGLVGAEFVVTNKDGAFLHYDTDGTKATWVTAQTDATTFTSDSAGKLTVYGLANGTYSLVETKAPTGYALPTGDAAKTAFTIEDKQDKTGPLAKDAQNVTNVKKGLLPSTGGSGIYAFLLIGAALMMGTAIWYKKSKNSAEV